MPANNIRAVEVAVGPQGWARWLREFRNTSVHRGRRLETHHMVPRRPQLVNESGSPAGEAEPGSHRVRHLGRLLEIQALDLELPPTALLAQVAALARRIEASADDRPAEVAPLVARSSC
jgi:hypothetical protein